MRRPPRPLDPRPRPRVSPALLRWLDALLEEDRVPHDRTTRRLLPSSEPGQAEIVAQANGTLSGAAVAAALGRRAGVRVKLRRRDGGRVRSGQAVLELSGDLRRILGAERTMLNLVMHLSGVATLTRRAVAAAGSAHGGPLVMATRKTLPGLRDLEKQAVVDGGGFPHRRDLAGAVLVKRPHLELVPMAVALGRARDRGGFVEVEVTTPGEAVEAARLGANAVLVDNLAPAEAARVVRALQRTRLRRRVWVELSGGISVRNLPRYRRVGADAVSLGSLTHSAPALPFHLVLRGTRPPPRRVKRAADL